MSIRQYECRICGKVIEYEDWLPNLYPFCSERCKRVDLYRWFSGHYVINRDLTPEELADLPDEKRTSEET